MIAKLVLSFLTLSSVAHACPVNLAQSSVRATPTMSLCEAYDRYYAATWQLRAKGVRAPRTIGNAMAPRFINYPDWLAKRTDSPTSAVKIYDPAPVTWDRWEDGADIVDAKASLNSRRRTFPAIDLNWILQLHGQGLKGLNSEAGHFRGGEEVGRAFNERTAMTRKQIEGVLSLPFRQISNGQPLVRFRPTVCLQQQSDAFKAKFLDDMKAGRVTMLQDWQKIPADQFFKGADGNEHQCGFILYAPRVQIQEQLDLLIKTVNEKTAAWSYGHVAEDPIALASMVQRWFISIHPFADGNGRVSRYMMDLLIESLGLPAPLLKQMNDDVYTTNEEWRDEVGRGIERAVRATEACARDIHGLGCAAIDTGVVQ